MHSFHTKLPHDRQMSGPALPFSPLGHLTFAPTTRVSSAMLCSIGEVLGPLWSRSRAVWHGGKLVSSVPSWPACTVGQEGRSVGGILICRSLSASLGVALHGGRQGSV